MQRLNYFSSVCMILAVIITVSCADHDLADFQACEDFSFEAEVEPIIAANCAVSGCHDGSLGTTLNWTDFETFQQKAETGIVKTRVVNREMPPPGSGITLTEGEIDIIACWVDNGAKNN